MSRALAAAILILCSVAHAGPKLDRHLVPEHPGPGEIMNLVVTVETDNTANVTPPPQFPDVAGVEYMGTSSAVETRSMFTNGRFITTQSRSFTYQLLAQKKGDLTIPALPFKIDGYVLRTSPLKVTVVEGAGGGAAANRARGRSRAMPNAPAGALDQIDEMEEMFNQMLQRRLGGGGLPGGQRPGRRGDQDQEDQKPVSAEDSFFIQATTDKTKAYVGEQITTNFYLVTRGQIRDIDTLRYPDLKGFWKEDLEMATRLNFENVQIEGVPHQRALLVSYALFPIHAGSAVIDGYRAKCTVLTPQSMSLGRAFQFTKSSTPIKIEVLDVPAPKPADFTGAVGHFRTTATFEPATGSVDQPVTLRVRFEGQGNAKLIELPKLNLPPSLEIYETKSQAKFVRDGSSFKEFDVLIIPRQPGRFDLGAVTVSTFDPATKTYVSSASAPLELTVTGQASTPAAFETATAPTDPAAPPGPPAEPGPPELASEVGTPPVAARTWWILTGLIYAAAAGTIGFAGYRAFRHRPLKASLAAIVRGRVARTRALAGEAQMRRVGVELTNTIYYILGQLSEQGGASQDLARLLERTPPSLRNELAEPLGTLLARCEALSFAPDDVIKSLGESDQVDRLIADFERTVNRAIELAEI